MRVSVVPFLTPPVTAVTHSGWSYHAEAGVIPLPPDLADWDYQRQLELSATLSIQRTTVTDSCELEPTSGLAVVVTAISDHTRTERRIAMVEVLADPGTGHVDTLIRVSLPGQELGGRLTLLTSLVVTDPRPKSELAPASAGSMLWRDSQVFQLQGVTGQFPTDAEDFRLTRPTISNAGWVLRVDTEDPDASFLGSVRLTLNSGNKAVARLLQAGQDDETLMLGRTLEWDITRQLVGKGLSSEEVRSVEVDADAVSVAGVLRNMIAMIWHDTPPATVRLWADKDPSRIESHLQNHCRVP